MPMIRIALVVLAAALPYSAQAQPACGSWETLARIEGDRVSDMVAFDDVHGVQLYVGGNFAAINDPVSGRLDAFQLARWDGTTWSIVPGPDGTGQYLTKRVIELEVWDDGTGPALYVGGDFERLAGLEANGLARWDGTTWSVLGSPATAGLVGRVHAIVPHDAGDGEKLYIAGTFRYPDLSDAPNVFVWDGENWTPVGDNAPDGSPVYDLVSFGGDLYASGPFMFVEGDIRSGIARFDGDSWSVPVSDDQRISSTEFWPLLSWSIDGRDVLISSGRFSISQDGETIARNVAAWDGDRWSALPGVGVLDQEGQPIAMTLFDDGSGEALFIGGGNSRGRTEQVNRWKAGSFGPVIGRSTDTVFSLAVFDNGSGLSLYAGGRFEGFARWRPAPACSIDLTGDCVADLFDFLEFQNLFDAGDDRVDFDGDGRLTLFDFLAFQNAFDAGCP